MSESVTTTSTLSTIAAFPTVATLAKHEGETVTLRGWLYNMRASGKLLFPIFRDGTGTIQGIVPKAAVSDEVTLTPEVTPDCSFPRIGRMVVRIEPMSIEPPVTELTAPRTSVSCTLPPRLQRAR